MNKLQEIKKLAPNYSILIADDDPEILTEMQKLLSQFNFKNIYLAKDGEEALNILKEKRVDLVFSDLKMPKIDGIELSEIIKNLEANISIIIITAYTEVDDLIKLIKIGVDNYIIKPLDISNLIDVIFKEITKIYNKEFVNAHQFINSKNTKLNEIKSVVINTINFCSSPMFAKEKDEIFFINDSCFKKYHDKIDEKNFVSKKVYPDITIFKEKE